MMQATKSRHRHNRSTCTRILLCFTTSGRSLCERKMSSILVVVTNVLIHKASQMLFVHDDHTVEQIPAAVADPALGNAVLPRTSKAGPLRLDAEGLHGVDRLRVEAGTAIKHQVAGRGVVWERLAQLLDYPRAGRVLCHITVQDTAPVMLDDEEAVEDSEGKRRYSKEIHCGNRFTMIIEECHPLLRGFGISRSLSHPAQDRPFRNIEAKHLQLAMNPRRTPRSVFFNHAKDEFAQFPADTFSSHAGPMPREPRPIQPEGRPMPAKNCLRLHENQRPLPSRPQVPQENPEQFIGNGCA